MKKKKKLKKDYTFDNNDTQLFNKLKQLRLEFAKAENMPPYIIFHDKTLTEMVIKKPSTMEDMKDITGVGERKLQKYGEAFLKAINE